MTSHKRANVSKNGSVREEKELKAGIHYTTFKIWICNPHDTGPHQLTERVANPGLRRGRRAL